MHLDQWNWHFCGVLPSTKVRTTFRVTLESQEQFLGLPKKFDCSVWTVDVYSYVKHTPELLPITSDLFCNPKKWFSSIICRKYCLPNYLRSLLTHIYVHYYNGWAIIRVTTIQLNAISVTLKIDHFDKISFYTQLAWIVHHWNVKLLSMVENSGNSNYFWPQFFM